MFIASLVIIFHKFQIYAVSIEVIHWEKNKMQKSVLNEVF